MYLPEAPSSRSKYLFLNSGKDKFYLISTISTLILMSGMFLFVKSNPWFLPYTFFCIITFLYLFLTYFIGLFGKEFDFENHKRLVSKWIGRSAKEELDIYLPVCGEDIDVIKNTWDGVLDLKLAHEGKILVHVLDDGKSDELMSLSKRYGFNYIRRSDNHLKKAGNLRNAFKLTSAPFFIILDADFKPRKDFILEMMPYFYEDDKTCIVQSPQFFEITEDQTEVQKGAGSIQELFYRLIQVNRDYFKGPICVGSCAIYRRKHLEPFGGTAAIGYSEDVRTSYRITKEGMNVKYIPINLASGTCPEKWQQLFTQYYRWSMGSLSLLLSKEFWEKGLNSKQRICYLSGMFYYLSTGLYSIFYFVPSMYLLIFKPHMIHWYNLLFSLPSFLFGVFYMKYWMKLPYGLSALRVRHVSYFAHFFAFKDLILNTLEEWKATGAANKSKRYESFVVLFIFITLFVPTVTSALISYRIWEGQNPLDFALLIFFTAFNAWLAVPVIDDL